MDFNRNCLCSLVTSESNRIAPCLDAACSGRLSRAYIALLDNISASVTEYIKFMTDLKGTEPIHDSQLPLVWIHLKGELEWIMEVKIT
jgi:hypothetical protein